MPAERSFLGWSAVFFFQCVCQQGLAGEMYHRSSNILVFPETLCQESRGSGMTFPATGLQWPCFQDHVTVSYCWKGRKSNCGPSVSLITAYFQWPCLFQFREKSLKVENDTALEVVPGN